MPDTAAPLSSVQIAELVFLGDEFAAMSEPSSFLLCRLVPFVRWCRTEGVTLPALVATGFHHIPPHALAPLVIAAAAYTPPPAGERPDRFSASLARLVDALDAP